jgi:iron-sulfur cluster repair protein YtfE (RIC family)
MSDPLALATRAGWPEALRVLAETYPRAGWESHPNFDGLTRFWLDRHLWFRDRLLFLTGLAEQLLDRSAEPAALASPVAGRTAEFIDHLHGHHQIEDLHYFPLLAGREPRFSRAFEVLDRDHHALDAAIGSLTEASNALIRALPGTPPREAAAGWHRELTAIRRLLDRHLTDEEEIVVPVILRHGAWPG